MSNSSDAFVGAAGMNDKNRGLSHEITAGARSSMKIRRISAGSLPPSLSRPWRTASSSTFFPGKSSGACSRRRSRQ